MLNRILSFITLALILSSCVTHSFQKRKYTPGKFRIVKQHSPRTEKNTPQTDDLLLTKELESFEQHNISTNNNETKQAITPLLEKENTEGIDEITDITNYSTKKEPIYYSNDITPLNEFSAPKDTVFVSADSSIGNMARKAENKGITSLVLGILSFFIPFGLILAIVGLTFANRSLNSQYNTENGAAFAKAGKITSIISLILRILAIILILTLFLFLF